jgi:hypothetical protein
MTTHLIKLSVGPEKLSDLAGWQAHRLVQLKRAGREQELMHITRNTPKKAEELLDGGSIYWVIKGWVCARQKLLALRPLIHEGAPYCGLLLGHELIRVIPRKHRPFQGWRYLAAKDAPADMTNQRNYDELTDALQRELAGLGLL